MTAATTTVRTPIASPRSTIHQGALLAPHGRSRRLGQREESGSAAARPIESRPQEGTLFTIPSEAVFNTHPKVYRTALVGIGAPGTHAGAVRRVGEGVAKVDRECIRAELQAMAVDHIPHPRIEKILFHPAFPVDIRHNAKIFREKLALWAAGRLK